MNPDSKITSNKRHVGHNLRMICLYMGIKQSALATDLGLSQAEISRIESRLTFRLAGQNANGHAKVGNVKWRYYYCWLSV